MEASLREEDYHGGGGRVKTQFLKSPIIRRKVEGAKSTQRFSI